MRSRQEEHSSRGFTLVEILVTIAIISVLASVVMVAINPARAKSRDAKRLADFKQIQTALQLYYDANGSFPANPTPGIEVCGGSAGWNTVMNQLVNGRHLGGVPVAPTSGTWAQGNYCYYSYGAGNQSGAMLVTSLEDIAATTTPPKGSCRPFDVNWCSYSIASKGYCLCNPF